MRRHLYLDIDGVLNAYERHVVRDQFLRWPEYVAYGREYVAPAMVEELNSVIADYDVSVYWLTTWESRAGDFGKLIGLEGSESWWIDDDLLHEHEARVWAQQAGVNWVAPHGLHGITPENITSMRNSFGQAPRES